MECVPRTSSLDLVAMLYLSSKASSLVQTWWASLEGDDSLAHFLFVQGMVEKKQSGKEATCESLIYYGLETELNTFLVMVLAASWAQWATDTGTVYSSIDWVGPVEIWANKGETLLILSRWRCGPIREIADLSALLHVVGINTHIFSHHYGQLQVVGKYCNLVLAMTRDSYRLSWTTQVPNTLASVPRFGLQMLETNYAGDNGSLDREMDTSRWRVDNHGPHSYSKWIIQGGMSALMRNQWIYGPLLLGDLRYKRYACLSSVPHDYCLVISPSVIPFWMYSNITIVDDNSATNAAVCVLF